MKTKLQIIEETVAYYSEDVNRRAVENESCVYLTTDGRMCAVGRLLVNAEELQKKLPEDTLHTGVSFLCGNLFTDKSLREDYRGHNVLFWTSIQDLHDSDTYWDSCGLSTTGKEFVEYLKKEYV